MVSAGLGKTLQVGIYRNDDINAFATGVTRNRSLVAFSSAILEKMDEEALAAVAAHEIALTRHLLTVILVFLGSLWVKAFSRHREFKADHLAAQLSDRHA